MNTVGYFEIHASDPKVAADFYSAVFGWKFTKGESQHLEYWHIETGNINGGLLKRSGKFTGQSAGANAFVCSMEVEDFEKSKNNILKNGGKVMLEKFPVPGRCWQGYFLDTQGNTFGIFEVDESAA